MPIHTEFEHIWGNNKIALRLIEEAVSRTPHIFEPKRLYVEILLKEGNRTKAQEVLRSLEERVNSRDPSERRSNYRAFLETNAHYLTEVGRYDEAKALYSNPSISRRKSARKLSAKSKRHRRKRLARLRQTRYKLFDRMAASGAVQPTPAATVFDLMDTHWPS
jgi:hypothetical protein